MKSIHFKNSVLLFCMIFDWLIFHYFFQLMPAEVSLTISWKSNEKLVNQKLCKTIKHCFYNECSLVRTLCKTFFDKISFSSTWTELRYVAFFSKIMFMTTTFSVVVFCCYCRNMTTYTMWWHLFCSRIGTFWRAIVLVQYTTDTGHHRVVISKKCSCLLY